jgi:hypothetical protein
MLASFLDREHVDPLRRERCLCTQYTYETRQNGIMLVPAAL